MRRLGFLLMAALLLSCSLLTKYEQDGQPCDMNAVDPALSCLSDAGYRCADGFCTKGSPSVIDAGRADGG